MQEILNSIRESFSSNSFLKKYANEKLPLREDLFSADQIEQYGLVLAKRHKILTGKAPNTLLKRLAENEDIINEVHEFLTESVKSEHPIIPAGEWLLDNFYLIQEQIRIGKKHLPKSYNQNLPRIIDSSESGIPRVYHIATEIISHSDARVDLKGLSNFIRSYQTLRPLKIGELWAIPIMLRLALIENLRRLSIQIARDRINQNIANYWADQMIKVAKTDPKSLILLISDMARSQPSMVSSFVAEMTRQLQGKGPALALPLSWIEQVLSENGQTGNELIHQEIQKQASDQVTMSNSIGSLRFLGTTNWQDFVESHSIVEHILREDLDGVYTDMDFSTRDQYRHVVEKLSKSSSFTEAEVAHMATDLSKNGMQMYGIEDKRSHVGYYLIGRGIPELEKEVKPILKFKEKLKRWVLAYPYLFYVGSILLLTLLISFALSSRVFFLESKFVIWAGISFLSLISSSYLSITLLNWLITLFIFPKIIPRMDFMKGIPEGFRTLIIIPCMPSNIMEINTLLETLEVHFLANKHAFLHFGLLTDFNDSSTETNLEDVVLLNHLEKKINELNLHYMETESKIFYWFHRPRKWNAKDGCWMGYERKRGKLTQLNDLLRGEAEGCFSNIIGDAHIFPKIKYVITLDSDTTLPREAACKMISSMAHPLNKAYYDEKKERVTHGYGILQPRLAISLPGSTNSIFARMHGNDQGIDPYSKTASDVYQDLFGEGSFIGKGIYDIDIFRKGMDNRFPENRILSHDLLEGCYLRSGLLSDVQLYEEYPSQYRSDIKRRFRWIRGDWQIASWVLPWVPNEKGGWRRNTLSSISRWKIFDNLRRSLVSISLILLLISGWTFLHDAWFWSISISVLLILPSVLMAIRDLFSKPQDISFKQHFKDSIDAVINHIFQNLFLITCLPYEAYYNIKAIIITLWRLLITHKNLLVWSPSKYNFKKEKNKSIQSVFQASYKAIYLEMFIAPFLGILGIIYLSFYSPMEDFIAGPILLLWIISPIFAWYISRPVIRSEIYLGSRQIHFLRIIAWKTWSFFENFVNENENWLPPDNYQEHPNPKIAHRTSPTNIGLSLMSNLAATDLGYSTNSYFITRTQNTFSTLDKMERFKGHFFNWYDTLSLEPLHPRYISTVDSGNLSSHLLTLRQGILQKINDPIITRELFTGIKDALEIFRPYAGKEEDFINFETILQEIYQLDTLAFPTLRPKVNSLVYYAEKLKNIHTNDSLELSSLAIKGISAQCISLQDELDHFSLNSLEDSLIPEFSNFLNLNGDITLKDLSEFERSFITKRREIGSNFPELNSFTEIQKLDELETQIRKISQKASLQIEALNNLAKDCIRFAENEFEFIYDYTQDLFSIGFNVDENKRDGGYYDLLASEARICSFLAISQHKIPQKSWFTLGRQLTNAGGNSVLLSWSGSMFEYLMPLLIMPTYHNTLLDQTYHTMVDRQIEYGKKLGVPWGISESGYNLTDTNLNYQYRAFGVPELGLMRGLGEDLVIAPYASIMALMVNPKEAFRNLELQNRNEFEGSFGYYESIDYTPSRLPRGQKFSIIRSYMAHHKGMSLLSLDYFLLNKPMQTRFLEEPMFQASLLLLQERIPKSVNFFTPPPDMVDLNKSPELPEMRILKTADTIIPEVQLLSNGRYHVMISNSGGGYSRFKNLAITRWQEDSTRDSWGTFCYIRDLESNSFFSTTHHPSLKEANLYEAIFTQGRAEFKCSDLELDSHSEIVVSQEDDVEIRRVHITNRSRRHRSVELTTYAEVVLAPSLSDALHPAFSNLFIETEIIKAKNGILCTRRPRSEKENNIWMIHLVKVDTNNIQKISYETDRLKFIGRTKNLKCPQALSTDSYLSGTQGPVLDPIVSIQYRIKITPGESVCFDLVYGIGETKKIAEDLMEKYQDTAFIDRAFELAWTQNQVVLRQINAKETDAQIYDKLASSILFAQSSLRADPSVLIKNTKGQSGLWGYSISGDFPIVLVRITNQENISLVQNMVKAHAYWKLKGLRVDLIIWNEELSGYRQELQNQILALISDGIGKEVYDRPGGIFVKAFDQIASEDRILMQTVARIEITDQNGTLSYQADKRNISKTNIPNFIPQVEELFNNKTPLTITLESLKTLALPELMEANGLGGFSMDGKEYIIQIDEKHKCPQPWVNVIANADFGTVISENGQSYTWAVNAHEFRLTPWTNDSVTDASGETFYIRDEDSGEYWSPSALPCPGNSSYIIKHGFGYSEFEHIEKGIYSKMTVFVDLKESIKFSIIKIRNHTGKSKKLSITGYIEWVLGDLRSKSLMYIVTEKDPETGSIIAKNVYNKDFNNSRVSYFDLGDSNASLTGDRTEFIGRNNSLSQPLAMRKIRLSGKLGAGLDPCGAFQTSFILDDVEEKEIVFFLGSSPSQEEARKTIQKFRKPQMVQESLGEVKAYWEKLTTKLKVNTANSGLNILANGWLLYQTLACRFWARSGFYQSGGAFGFRDQLQDSMAIVEHEPQLVRDHILLSASKQFMEGDVLHWWHPPHGNGVRTRCSDDFLWLVMATCRYISSTGDNGILDRQISFVEGRLLHPGEESNYDVVNVSSKTSSLYEHLVLAIKHALPLGVHQLPLMGSGDWNDGMDQVGIEGKGESVWLAFFLYSILTEFMPLVKLKKDETLLKLCLKHSEILKSKLELEAWDGLWYKRAFFDNGTPLGSNLNPECKIDSISQSWSVLSNMGSKEHQPIALESAYHHLVRKDQALIQLLDPPFDQGGLNPGYIKGYVPGVRENGGQYTHAAIWLVMAYCKLKMPDRAWELFSLINPIEHSNSAKKINIYQTEPYVVAADVYRDSLHPGKGGWTWYTGSAGWMYRLIMESFLGFKKEGDRLNFDPCMPENWEGFSMEYRYFETPYKIQIYQRKNTEFLPSEKMANTLKLDGEIQSDPSILLKNDLLPHFIELTL